MRSEYDLLILGGGCAGLSLGMRLAKQADRCPQTLILERRAAYAHDRTWCFWDDGTSAMRHLAKHRWNAMTIKAASQSTTVSCEKSPYAMIAAEDFYAEALGTIATAAGISLANGLYPLREPVRHGKHWQVETAAGQVRAKMIVDTRPGPAPRPGGATLWQSFYGHEIEFTVPVFDPSRLELMDFSPSDPKRIQFTYVLPVSDRRALIEVTVLSPQPVEHQFLSTELAIATSRYAQGNRHSILRSEHGILPMGQTHNPAQETHPTFVKAGLAGGAARPSTGYAFQRIQKWADLCAARIAAGKLPISHPADPLLLRALDHLFLSVLRSRPEKAPYLFHSLFEKTSTPSLLRFLSDSATPIDFARVAWALPFLLFLQEIPRALITQNGQPRESLVT